VAEVVVTTLQAFKITAHRVSYFVLDNATNNEATVTTIARKLEFKFNAIHRCLRCGPHTLNLIRQVLLWGKKAEAFNNDHCSSDITEETELIRD